MITFFIYLCAYIWVTYKAFIVTGYIINRLIFIAYLYFTCYDKAWAASIPFGHLYTKRELAGIPMPLIVIYIISVICFILIFHPVWFIIMWFLSTLMNYFFARMYIDNFKPWLYAFVPFAKFFIMAHEIIQYTRNEGEHI